MREQPDPARTRELDGWADGGLSAAVTTRVYSHPGDFSLKLGEPETPMISRPTIFNNLKPLQLRDCDPNFLSLQVRFHNFGKGVLPV